MWNQRPRDVANVVRWTANAQRDLNWQVVNLNVSAEELLDVQVLYLRQPPIALTDAQAAGLRTFVEMGGMVVGHADCGRPLSPPPSELGEKLFPL